MAATRQTLRDDDVDSYAQVGDAIDLVCAAAARATRDMLERDGELTEVGRQKLWRAVVGRRFNDVVVPAEFVLADLERQIAQSIETATQVRLPAVGGDVVLLRAEDLRERRRYLVEAEDRAPGSVYVAAVRAAVTGVDDALLVALQQAPPESGIRLTVDQQAKVDAALIVRRASYTGVANAHATALTRVISAAHAFAATASGPSTG